MKDFKQITTSAWVKSNKPVIMEIRNRPRTRLEALKEFLHFLIYKRY